VNYKSTLSRRAIADNVDSIDMSKISEKLGANIKKIRARKRISQGDIYRKIGMDRSYLSGIENGKKNITIEILEKIADALGVPARDLLK
jgi:transcriptional regulator with XRE-family HTH domain